MKSCAYCGQENADERTHCQRCGTELAPPSADEKPKEARDWTSIKLAFRWVAGGVFMILLYFLSPGPVTRYCATVTSQNLPATSSDMFILRRTVTYPKWVGIAYAPALALRSADTSSFTQLYDNYLDWWENAQTPK